MTYKQWNFRSIGLKTKLNILLRYDVQKSLRFSA